MADGTIEIITGHERRRRWNTAEKLRIVAESEEPGACVTAVAVRHDVYPSLVFNWRRQVREGRLSATGSAGFMPVRLLASADQVAPSPPPAAGSAGDSTPGIEITLADGSRIHIRDAAQLPLLRPVLAALRG